jgi:hypothetical protein
VQGALLDYTPAKALEVGFDGLKHVFGQQALEHLTQRGVFDVLVAQSRWVLQESLASVLHLALFQEKQLLWFGWFFSKHLRWRATSWHT